MPDRTDKRDLLAAAASVTGMQVEFIDGFDGSKANPKAVPDSWNKAESNSTYGCWRAHMNIFQKSVSIWALLLCSLTDHSPQNG